MIDRIDCTWPAQPTSNVEAAVMNRYVEAVENMFSLRTSFLQQMLDPRRDIDQECGYPESMTGSGFGSINPDLYRVLYEREAIATRVVQVYPNACWQKTPMVFETEDPEIITPFEVAWDSVGKQLRGEQCYYQDEEGSPVWNYLHRVDTLSGIGTFGVVLLGIDDGRNLDQPLDGVASYDPTGNMEVHHEYNWDTQLVRREVVVNGVAETRVVGVRRTYNGKRVAVYPTSPRAEPVPDCNRLEVDYYPVYDRGTDGLPKQTGHREYTHKGQTNNEASPTNNGVRIDRLPTTNELPSRFKETSMESDRDQYRPGFEAGGPKNAAGTGLLSSGQVGTDAQYVGIQLSPSEYPAAKASTEPRKLLFMRVFDETLVQIVQYEANVRNPRFGLPVMYRITLNDPREQHSGIGLPMATVRVHWSRIIHVADNNGSSDIFGVPRMRPVLNRLLDLRKIYASSAEGYWQQAFAKLVLSTHPQLGGDVKLNVPQLQNMLENVRNGLQREMLLMGMGAESIAPSVTDPTGHVAVHIEAICIQLGCPIRVFKGSERGELASTQDDDEWLDHIRFRQSNQVTPKIVVPLIDRLIACGVLPVPGKGTTPTGKSVPAGKKVQPSQDNDATGMQGSSPVVGNSRLLNFMVNMNPNHDEHGRFSSHGYQNPHEAGLSRLQKMARERHNEALDMHRRLQDISLDRPTDQEGEKLWEDPHRVRVEDMAKSLLPKGYLSFSLRKQWTSVDHPDGTPAVIIEDTKDNKTDEHSSSMRVDGYKRNTDKPVTAVIYPGEEDGAVEYKLRAAMGLKIPPKLKEKYSGKFKDDLRVGKSEGGTVDNTLNTFPQAPDSKPFGAKANTFPSSTGPSTPPAGGTPPKPPKITVPDTGKPAGYSVQWPDLDSLGDKDKAAIALQVTQALSAYIAGGCEAVLPVFEFFVHVLGWDEEMVAPILEKVQSQSQEEPPMTIPPPGEPGHPATSPPPPVVVGKGDEDSDSEDDDEQ